MWRRLLLPLYHLLPCHCRGEEVEDKKQGLRCAHRKTGDRLLYGTPLPLLPLQCKDKTKTNTQTQVGNLTPGLSAGLSLAAPHASCEDLTMRESPSDDEDVTPTASCSLGSTPMGSGCSSLAVTPTHEGSHNVGSGH